MKRSVGVPYFTRSSNQIKVNMISAMQCLRRMLQAFRDVMNDTSLSSKDLLDTTRFSALDEYMDTVCSNDENATLKAAYRYLLKSTAQRIKGVHLDARQDAKAPEVDKFFSVLELRWTSCLHVQFVLWN